MATYYYYSSTTGRLSATANWWNNITHTSPANTTPTSTDTVIVLSNISDSGSYTYNQFTSYNASISTGGITTTLNAYFSGTSLNYSSITPGLSSFFSNYSINYGTINGAVIFNDWSYNGSGGKYTTALFNSINNKGINSSFLIL